jgi:phage/plasmid-like protein (TIGR03299 family)
MPANIGEMFYFGEMPWHGLGYEVSKPLTVQEALRAGRLDWDVEMIPLQTAEKPPSPALNRMAVVRKDRAAGHGGRVLGVIHNDFKPLQNREGAIVFDAVFGKGKPVYHTGGYLKNGEVVWLLAALPKVLEILSDDIVKPYVLFTNSHNGSVSIDFRLTTVRVVCQNTLSLALSEGNVKTVFKHSHEGGYATLQEEAEEFFQSTLAAVDALEKIFKFMVKVPLRDDGMEEFVHRVFPDPKPPAVPKDSPSYRAYLTNRDNMQNARREIHRLSEEGKGADLKGVRGSLWGGFNAVTEYIDHHHWLGGNYMDSGLFGSKAALKRKAYQLAVTYLSKAA